MTGYRLRLRLSKSDSSYEDEPCHAGENEFLVLHGLHTTPGMRWSEYAAARELSEY